MNKFNLIEFLNNKLDKHCTTLKESSYDATNKEYLCSDENTANVFCFDSYVEQNYHPLRLPASPDAIVLGHKKLYFVEFKNQLPRDIDAKNMKDKLEKGTSILKELLQDFSPRDIEYIFCVVHKKQGARYFNSSHIQSNIARFGLSEKNAELGGFYSNILTEDIEYYKATFSQLSC